MKNDAKHLLLEGLSQVHRLLELLPELNRESLLEGTPEFDPAPLIDCQALLISALDKLNGGETLECDPGEVSKAIKEYFTFLIKFQDWSDDRDERLSNAPLN